MVKIYVIVPFYYILNFVLVDILDKGLFFKVNLGVVIF